MITQPETLFLDTSYYVSQGLKFTTAEFEALKKQFRPKSLRLLLPDVARRELQRKFDERAGAVAMSICSLGKEHPVGLLSDWPYTTVGRAELKEKVLAALLSEWEKFQEYFEVERLSDMGNLERVLEWYFDRKPPFGDGKKSKEFPDALVTSVLDKHCVERKISIAVISRDGDYEKACENRPRFRYFRSLSAFIEACLHEQETVERVHALLEQRSADFDDGIKKYFLGRTFSVRQDENGHVANVKVTDIDTQELRVLDLDGEIFTIGVSGVISFRAHVEYEDRSIPYDFPSQEMYESYSYVAETVNDYARFTAVVDIETDKSFKEFVDYCIGDFSPEHVDVNAEQHYDRD
jgi:hypothetical protein